MPAKDEPTDEGQTEAEAPATPKRTYSVPEGWAGEVNDVHIESKGKTYSTTDPREQWAMEEIFGFKPRKE